MAKQGRVLARVREEVERQVAAVDEALRDMEDDIADEMGALQQADASKWRQAREKRDAAMQTLDQHALAGARPREGGDLESKEEMEEEEEGSGSGRRVQQDRIAAMADALRTLTAQHDEMAAVEAQLAASLGSRAEQLGRLRLQRAAPSHPVQPWCEQPHGAGPARGAAGAASADGGPAAVSAGRGQGAAQLLDARAPRASGQRPCVAE